MEQVEKFIIRLGNAYWNGRGSFVAYEWEAKYYDDRVSAERAVAFLKNMDWKHYAFDMRIEGVMKHDLSKLQKRC